MATMTKIHSIGLESHFEKAYDIGYKQLNRCLHGLKEGTIITIGARPGMGKTIFLNNIVMNLLEKYNLPTLYISLEVNKNLLALELATIGKGKSYREVRNDEITSKEYLETLKQKNYNLYISDDCYCIADLEKLLEENKEIKFLMIDYIQLLKNENHFGSGLDQYNDVLDRIKILAKNYHLVIILLSQLSRNVEYRESKRPRIVDLKQSGNLEDISDIVMFLYRESYYNREMSNMIMEITIAKNRYGDVGASIYLDYDENKSRFIDY